MNIQLIAEQIGRIHLTLETTDAFEVYGGTWLGAFEVSQTGTAQWTLTVREQVVAAAPLRDYKVYARQLATGREWEVLSGKILVSARTAAVPADKLAPVEYFVTVPVVDHDVDAVGSTIVQGIPGPKGDKGDPGPPGEGGMTEEERATLNGAAQRGGDNTFTASNTFTGSVDMSGASVTPPEGWNVEGVTAEQVQAVVPIAWDDTSVTLGEGAVSSIRQSVTIGAEAKSQGWYGVAVGYKARLSGGGVAIGSSASVVAGTAIGNSSSTAAYYTVAVGDSAGVSGTAGTAVGYKAKASKSAAITVGAEFSENIDGTTVKHSCTTEGTGSITIGAGANTLNNGDTESSNSVTIGCKAENKGADSVVIGAQASGTAAGTVVIGAGASAGSGNYGSGVAVGRNAKANKGGTAFGAGATANDTTSVTVGKAQSEYSGVCVGDTAYAAYQAVALGYNAKTKSNAISIGCLSKANANNATAVGLSATVSDYGATVIRSTAEDGTYTQLYFSGANTPLANTYHDGAPMLGYVTKDSAGNVVAAGTRSLLELLTDNSTFAPASLDENGEWVMPKVFHPSDLDMPQEEPSEVEEYTPLPVYPIVEPEDLPPHGEVEKS